MKLFIAILSLFSCLCTFAYASEEPKDNKAIFFITPLDVLSAYEGKWYGSKELFLRGKLLGDTVVESQNTLISENLLSYSRSERLLDKYLDIKCTILSIGDKLYMSTKDENSKDVIYEGLIKSNSVEWHRLEKIFAYDYTKDIFIKKDGEIIIQTYSVKPFFNNDSLMYIEYKGSLSKPTSKSSILKIKPENLDISKLKI